VRYTTVHEAADVTPEILSAAESIYDGWFADGHPIDWPDFLDRLEGAPLEDESTLDLGDSLTSPAISKIRRHILKYREL
jgi:hypothetical protein